MPFNLLNTGAAMGQQQAGLNSVLAQRIAAQRLAQAARQYQQILVQSSQAPGMQPPQPGANTGGGINSPQGGPVNLMLPNGMPAGNSPPAIFPSGGTGLPPGLPPMNVPGAGQADPFNTPNLASLFFGPGGGTSPADFQAFEQTEKIMRPHGQLQARSALETQKESAAMQRTQAQIGSREWIAQTVENGRNNRDYAAQSLKVQQLSNVNLRAVVTTASQQLANGVKDPDGKLAAQYAAGVDELNKRARGAGYSGIDVPAPSETTGVPVPPQLANKPDGTTVPDETGKLWEKRGNQMVPQAGR